MKNRINLNVQYLDNYDRDWPDIGYAQPGDAGFDLRATQDAEIPFGSIVCIPTGAAFEIPEGYEIQIRSRSGLATQGLMVVNAPGTIDSGYRGEVKVILGNIAKNSPVRIYKGDRIAQGVLASIVQAAFRPVAELSNSSRGSGGFGSTGVK